MVILSEFRQTQWRFLGTIDTGRHVYTERNMSEEYHQDIPLLLTVQQVGKVLNVSRSKVYTLFDTGELSSVLVGSSRRISENQLADYLRRINA